MRVGLVAALPAEVRCFVRARPQLNIPFALTPHLTGIVCGIGRAAATAAARTLLDLNVEALVSWGTAGALSRELRSGDLLLPEYILSGDRTRLITDGAWLKRIRQALQTETLTIHNGHMTEAREILTAALKQELHLRTAALAADMESAAILEFAISKNVPCIAIRTVVDEAGMTIPGAMLRNMDHYGRPKPAGVILEIFRSPRIIGDLCRLGIGMHKAMSTLQVLVNRTNHTLMYNS